ncbi:MAG: class II fructose-bisphosphate aldolase [Anaerolineaceae bacterium]|nr:class II fructose-bisphosphate aldolase [Anaerolineaceae bacterium]
MNSLRAKLCNLTHVLPAAEKGNYAVGSFSPRYAAMIRPVLRAAQTMRSPVIAQISENEFNWYQESPFEFAEEFFRCYADEQISVPVVLHLDHTRVFSVIKDAIDAGFTSVMIDASAKELDENIALSKEIVEYAHARGVSVEAELGRIGTADFIETDKDEELFTVPEEALRFVNETGVDALAVSVGTAHGVYKVRQPRIDFERLRRIRALTPVHLVLHGGSGVPASMIHEAIRLPGGGISKVNIATDLELAALGALGREQRLLNAEMSALPTQQLEAARGAVERTVINKIKHYVGSDGKARSA